MSAAGLREVELDEPAETPSPPSPLGSSLCCHHKQGLTNVEEKELEEIAEEMRAGPRVMVLHPHRSKTVFFVRHAEALHNEAFKTRGRAAYLDPNFVDPALTLEGQSQAQRLGTKLASKLHKIDLVVVSPLKRTLETAAIAMSKLDSVPWVACELVRERIGVHPCDKRRPISVAKAEYPAVDFSLVEEEEDVTWTADHRETGLEIARRGVAFLDWLRQRPEEMVAVVSHSAFLISLFNQVLSCPSELQGWFQNAEVRQVTLSF